MPQACAQRSMQPAQCCLRTAAGLRSALQSLSASLTTACRRPLLLTGARLDPSTWDEMTSTLLSADASRVMLHCAKVLVIRDHTLQAHFAVDRRQIDQHQG